MPYRTLPTAFLIILFCFAAAQAQARVINVQPGPGQSAEQLYYACLNVQNGDEIVLAEGVYVWDSSIDYQGPIIINNKHNIRIRGEGEVLVMCTDPYATPITIMLSTGIQVENIMAGHLIKRGYCSGNVLDVTDSSDVLVTDCVFHGSGVVGIMAYTVRNLHIQRTAIAGCTMAATDMWSVSGFILEDCLIADNSNEYFESPLLSFSEDVTMELARCLIVNNVSQSLAWEQTPKLALTQCVFAGNSFMYDELGAYVNKNGNVRSRIGEACDANYGPVNGDPVAETFQELAPRNKSKPGAASQLPDLAAIWPVSARYQLFLKRLGELEANPSSY